MARTPRPLTQVIECMMRQTEVKQSGCIEFTGRTNNGRGYGKINYEGKPQYCHRLVWIHYRGKIPKGFLVLHKCDNGNCVSINHLFVGTSRDNTQDMMRKGRDGHGVNVGEEHPSSKLTNAKVLAIRRLLKARRFSQREIGLRFGIIQATVSQISRGKTWKHV